ncbi:MAG: peptide chain release factor-like protein, partial [Deltaproteobacteria bacterium]|nr:peptide chain release factor-like protein [Deltaproteobacteria bacterium]
MEKYQIREADLVENFIRGSGAGGQKVNKTSSTVQLLHKPS